MDDKCNGIRDAIAKHGDNFHLEFRHGLAGQWYRSPHPARPRAEAQALVARLNAADPGVAYRCCPWDGE